MCVEFLRLKSRLAQRKKERKEGLKGLLGCRCRVGGFHQQAGFPCTRYLQGLATLLRVGRSQHYK